MSKNETPEPATVRIATMPDAVPAARRFWRVDDGGATVWVVAASPSQMLALLADLDLMDSGRLFIEELTADQARMVRLKPEPNDTLEVTNLADAPLGATYSTEA